MRPFVGRAVLLVALLFIASLVAIVAPSGAAAPSGRYHEDTVLVAFEPGTPGAYRASAHASERGRVENTMEWLNLDVVRLPEGVDPAVAAVRYERNPNVAYAHPNWEVSLLSTPNDTLFKDEWGLHNTGQAVTSSFVRGVADKDIDAPEGWGAAFGAGSFPSSGGVRVGILDTGIDLGHADLLNKTKACASALTSLGIVVNGSCSDDNLHGTHVAGTVGAITNNGVGVAGVAPNAEFAIFKGLDAAGFGFYADIIAGIHWLHTTGGARVISMSLGGAQDNALDRELTEAAGSALLIAAAGNDGDSTANYPAYHRDVMSVAATDAAGRRASFSNCNSDVEIAAPGVDVWSTLPGNSYGPLSGTSMATPHVSGVAAMIMWKSGSTDPGSTRTTLKNAGEGDGGCNGVSVANLALALGGSSEPPPPSTPGAIAGTVTDSRTKAALSGASVNCNSAGAATTDSAGKYSITDVAPSTYTCTASASGYRSKSQSVTVSSGQTTIADFALRK